MYCVAFSPDGNTLASGSLDNTARLWNPKTGEPKHVLAGHTREVRSVAFTRDGNGLASGSDDGTVRIWDVNTGEHQQTLGRLGSFILSIAFSPDGKTLFTASGDGTVLIWHHDAAPPAANSTVSVTPSWVTSPALGRELSLALNIESDDSVAGYQASVSFDPTALRYIDSAVGSYLPASAFVLPSVVEDDRVTLGALALNGEGRGNGRLATLTFEVLSVKASSVKLFEVSLVDRDAKRTFPLLEDGRVIGRPRLGWDVNRDGAENILDLMPVGANITKTGEKDADVNGDGVVGYP